MKGVCVCARADTLFHEISQRISEKERFLISEEIIDRLDCYPGILNRLRIGAFRCVCLYNRLSKWWAK